VDLGSGARGGPEELVLAEWFWSTVFYGGALLAIAGFVGIVRPYKRLHRGRRSRAFAITVLGLGLAWSARSITPLMRTSASGHGIDEFMPQYQFHERHETMVSASPERVFAAIRTVAADEIALFKLFTWLRRFGQRGPESLLNPPDAKPIVDVAVASGFMVLLDRSPQEIVLGTVLAAPKGMSRRDIATADQFRQLTEPGVIKGVLNFRVEPAAARTRVITETRVVATDEHTLALFTAYWRTIFPGSAILRVTWLRAIKARAERGS
jgi:hypothetical protein